jgi:transposase-like protein
MRLTREELDDLYNKQQLSTCKIARRLGVSDSAVCKWMDKLGLPRRSYAERCLQLDGNEIERLYTIERLNADEIARQIGVSEETIYRRLEARGIARRKSPASTLIYPRRDFSGDTQERAYLIGFRLGDLHVTPKGKSGNSIRISVGSTHVEQIGLFYALFSPYGHVQISPLYADGKCIAHCDLNMTFGFLLPKVDAIPDWILRSAWNDDEQPFLAFLAGYTDAEGSFGVADKCHARFRLASYDAKILQQARAILNDRLNIACQPVRVSAPRGTDKRGVTHHGDIWCLGIYRKSSLG